MYVLLIIGLARKNPPSTLRQERMARQRVAPTTFSERRGRRSRGLPPEAINDIEMDSDHRIMEADLMNSDERLLSSQRTNQNFTAKATLKEVMIAAPTFKIPSDHGGSIRHSQSPSSDGSALSSVRGQSSEYETPGTSTVVTPAESLGRRGSLIGISEKTGRGRPMGQLAQVGIHNKRMHEDILGDALLAQALQEDEYREDKPARGFAKRRRTVPIEDSQDEDLSLSDVHDVDLLETGHQPAKKIKTGGHLSLPTRVGRESAIKSMTDKVYREIMDTDSDDSDLSQYNIDEDLEDFEGSDASDDDMSGLRFTAPGEADAATATVASNRAAAASTVRLRGRNMAPRVTAGRNRYSRNRQPHDLRVSILHLLYRSFSN